jgi:hypothetical protein
VLGSCAVTLGSLVLLGDWKGTGPAVYWTLLAAGLGALVASFGYLAWQETAGLRARSPPPARSQHAVPSPHDGPVPRPTVPIPGASRSIHPHSGLGRAAVSAAARSSEDLWHFWTTPKSRPLGVEVAGPIAESWYFPSKSGAIGPFASRDEDLRFIPSPIAADESLELTPPPATAPSELPSVRPSLTPRTEPFSELELEALFPTSAEFDAVAFNGPPTPATLTGPAPPSRPAPPSEGESAPLPGVPPVPLTPPAPAGPATPDWDLAVVDASALGGSGAFVAGPGGLLPTLDSVDHQVYLEAINPMPPHLRSVPVAGPRSPEVPRARPARRRTPEIVCTMCSRKVAGFHAWVDCPRCGQPMCRECLGRSFLTGSDGHCYSCRDSHRAAG